VGKPKLIQKVKLKTATCFPYTQNISSGRATQRQASRQAEQAGGRPKEVVAFYFSRAAAELFCVDLFCVGQKVSPIKNQKVEKDKTQKVKMLNL
jgi:hypothetical protein